MERPSVWTYGRIFRPLPRTCGGKPEGASIEPEVVDANLLGKHLKELALLISLLRLVLLFLELTINGYV